MDIRLDTFQRLPPTTQLVCVKVAGTFLAQRCGQQGSVNLYHLPDGGRGFFAEVGFSAVYGCVMVLRSFPDLEALEDYAHGVRLPGE